MPDQGKAQRGETLNRCDERGMATLVTGGSGFIGRHLVKALSAQDSTVVSMYHHRLPEPMANVYPVCSDMSSVELLAAPLRGITAVVHLAWEGGLTGPSMPLNAHYPAPANQTKNLSALNHLIEAMERAGTLKIVFVSALGASRKAKSPFLQEKYLAELAVLNSRVPQKIIIRPGICCGGSGAHDRFIRSIVNMMKFPGVYPVPNADESVSPVLIDDMVETIVNCVNLPQEEASGVIELMGGEAYKIDELFKLVKQRYTKGAKLALRGLVGRSLIPILERESTKSRQDLPRISHFLSMGNQVNASIAIENPLKQVVPKKLHSLREVIK